MTTTAQTVATELGGCYAYTASDEISILFDPGFDRFSRGVEKLVSLSAGIASAAFTHAAGLSGHFDARIWAGAKVSDVVDYFSWRQADAARNALYGWCYWTLRENGQNQSQATERLRRATTSDKNELLFEHGINFSKVPAWQRRGVALWWENYDKAGHDPVHGVDVVATRRRLTVNRDLPMRQEYRDLVKQVITSL